MFIIRITDTKPTPPWPATGYWVYGQSLCTELPGQAMRFDTEAQAQREIQERVMPELSSDPRYLIEVIPL